MNRSDAAPSTEPTPAALRALGTPEVRVSGHPVVWPARSAEELLWFLHAHPQGVYRRELLARLWELEDTPASANRFRVALHRLRTVLGGPDTVTEQAGRYALRPDLIQGSDVAALRHAVTAPQITLEELREVLAGATGRYLPHLRGEWVDLARADHEAKLVAGHLRLARLACGQRHCAVAAQALTQATTVDPLISEAHHQRLMVCLGMTQDRYAATEQYRRYRRWLAQEVGDTPLPETVALAARLGAGERPCLDRVFVPTGLETGADVDGGLDGARPANP